MKKTSTLIASLACLFLVGCAAALFSASDLKNISAGETKTKISNFFESSCG